MKIKIKSQDNYLIKDNIKVTEKNEYMIWDAERELIQEIEFGDKKSANRLFHFIYNFDLESASEESEKFEDLLNRKNAYHKKIMNIKL
jgi:hypothetical protein